MGLLSSDSYNTSRPKVSAIIYQTSLSDWCRDVNRMPARQVEKVELCSASTSGERYGHRTEKVDCHTFLRVYLEPTAYRSQEVVLFERMMFFAGPYHSAVPLTIRPPEKNSSAEFDLACTVPQGSSSDIFQKLEVERSVEFDDHVTVQELATIVELIGKTTKSAWKGAGCDNLSRLFAFTCLVALASGKQKARRSPFEDEAMHFLDQLSWRVQDAESINAVKLIQAKRQEKSDS